MTRTFCRAEDGPSNLLCGEIQEEGAISANEVHRRPADVDWRDSFYAKNRFSDAETSFPKQIRFLGGTSTGPPRPPASFRLFGEMKVCPRVFSFFRNLLGAFQDDSCLLERR
jgi:hypothetical protein